MNIDKFKKTAESITLHGLGFLQVQLDANMRLHVWHPELPRRSCFEHSSAHNHRFSFTSLVLRGTQINTNFEIETEGAKTHTLYLHEGERTRFGNRPWIPDGDVRLVPTCASDVPAGYQYQIEQYLFHSTTPGGDGRVATLMRKTAEGDRGAHSACAVGVLPDVDFDRKQWGETELWDVVRDVLGAAP